MNYWKTTEVAYLRKYWGIQHASDIAETLGRSVMAVNMKATRLGLKSSLARQGQNLAELIELIEFGYHPTEIARSLNKSTKNIYNTTRDRLGGQLYKRLKQNANNRGRMTPQY